MEAKFNWVGTIDLLLEEGESFCSEHGPMMLGGIPTVADNAMYAEILRRELIIAPYEPPAPPTRWGVMTYTMVRRLEAVGKVEAALAALEANATAKWLFTTARWIWSDDQLLIDLLTLAGADSTTILAPDPNWSPSA